MIIYIILLLFLSQSVYSQENDIHNEDEYYEFWMEKGITVYGDRLATEAKIIDALNGSLSNRKDFIESDLLENAGFRRTGNIKYRKTEASEKGLSILHGFGAILSFGIVPLKPFFEIDYDKLPKGQYYSFEAVIIYSELKNISLDVYNTLKLEYMLQIEFANGIVIESTLKYYTEENIEKFEKLILSLPDSPENIGQIKERYMKIELPKIKRAFNRYNNPSEDYLRAVENLRNSFRGND